MSYLPPFMDASGLHISSYQDYEDYLVQQAQEIFGSTIYLANDSQDFQLLAALAKVAYDTGLGLQLVYNNRGPVGGVGTGLDGVVALNGIRRTAASYSTATVNLTGTAYTLITNGVVSDINGVRWNLPASVTLDGSGLASVTATCQVIGAIMALSGQINVIQAPTFGWASVTNPSDSTPGQPVETDSQLKVRQAQSVANPSQALTDGILGGVLAVTNVVDGQLYENDTNVAVSTINGAFNPNDYPPHSITLVVDGGDTEAIANAIYLRKTPGCYTDGDVTTDILDQYNVATTIRFYRPVEQTIEVAINITALSGYTSAIGDAVVAAIVAYINGLNIGQDIIISEIWQAALSVNTGQYPYFSLTSVTANISGDTPGTADIQMEFDWKPGIETADVTLVAT